MRWFCLFLCVAVCSGCRYSEWGNWASCSSSCADGVTVRTRTLVSGDGPTCPDTLQQKDCIGTECNHRWHGGNCEIDSWTRWGPCSAFCGTGTQKRTRRIFDPPPYGGMPCPATVEERECATQACPTPKTNDTGCSYSPWSTWTNCTKFCGTGTQQRTRRWTKCAPAALKASGKDSCTDLCLKVIQERKCNFIPCDGCSYTQWSTWDTCTVNCGTGTQNRTRQLSFGDQHNCTFLTQHRNCNQQPCNCTYGDWSSWTACTVTCGWGLEDRVRKQIAGPKGCHDTRQERTCKQQSCHLSPYDCHLGGWGRWGPCSTPCGGGLQERFRVIAQVARYGGEPCPNISQARVCGTYNCP
eukprot:TRINITY_DN68161_c3_g4_i1.p1 TRINITY_DN68161_c3_g4~~TRINITY_DN68161_c3_g4_i1.p1  ORF type:complete len:354 (-),score=15.68 TRINITY_DN68161_c3_g4_i1:901-1962(-)